MTTSFSSGRPGSVTTVVVLTVLAGVLDIVAGVVTWAFAGNDKVQDLTDASTGTITTLAIFTIVTGVVAILLGLGLRSGSNGARMFVSILMAIRAAGAVWVMIALGSHNLGEALVTLVTAVVILTLLWNSRANEFFA